MSEVYLTGRTKENVLEAAAEIDGAKVRTVVPAVSDFEAELQAAYKVIAKAAEKGEDIHLHTDLKTPADYLSGAYKPVSAVSKEFCRNIAKLKKQKGIEITGDKAIDKEKADAIYHNAFEGAGRQKIETPLNKPKREVRSNVLRGFGKRTMNNTPKPKWSVKVIQNGECIIDMSNLDFQTYGEEKNRRDAAYLADWWEQVEGAQVIRNNIPAHQNDFSKYKGTNMTAVDMDKDQMMIWQNGEVIYDGKITHDYKEKYARTHPDSEWAKELAEEAEKKAAVVEPEPEEQPEYEQLGFEF